MTDIGLNATLNAGQFVTEGRKVVNVLDLMTQALNAGETAAKLMDNRLAAGTAAKTRTVALYRQLVGLSAQYRKAQIESVEATEKGANATLRLKSQLTSLKSAVKGVADTDAKEYAAKRRTLDLYTRMIALANQAAQVKQREAAATKSLADAESRTKLTNLKVAGTTAVASNAAEQKAADDAATAATKRAAAAEKERTAAIVSSNVAAEGEIKNLASTRYALYQVAAAYGTVATAGLGFITMAVKTGVEYEAAFAQVKRTTADSGQQIGQLESELESLATSIPESFSDLSKIASLGAQMGISTAALGDFTDTVAKFSAISNVSADEAATSFGRLANLLKIPTTEYANLGSSVAALAVSSAATDSQILKTSQSIARAGATAGLSTSSVLGLSSAFASLAIPPEISRSSLQRVFAEVDSAIADGGAQLGMFAQALGLTSDEFIKLRKESPDQMFVGLLKYFHNVVEQGGNLTQVFKDLGIYSLRAAPVYSALADNIDLVTNSISLAVQAYGNGTYLDTATSFIFDTIQAKATKARNAVSNMFAGIGQTDAFRALIGGVLDTINRVATAISGLPGPIKAAVGAFAAFIGLWAAYKAAVALGTASMFAFRQISENGLKSSQVGLRELLVEARLAYGGTAAAADVATGAVNRNAAALAKNAEAAAAHAVAARADATAMSAQAVSGVGGAVGGAASGASGVVGVLGKLRNLNPFVKLLGGAAIFSAAMAGVDAIISLTTDHMTTAQQAAAKYGAALLDAGGGAQSLLDAINKDAEAFKNAGEDTSKLDDYYGKVVVHSEDLANGTTKVTKTFYDASGAAQELSSKIEYTGASAESFAGNQDNAKSKTEGTNQALQDQVTILGKNSEAWLNSAIVNLLTGDNSPINNAQLSTLSAIFNTTGKDLGLEFGKAIKIGVSGGSEAMSTYLAPLLARLTAKSAEEGRKAGEEYVKNFGSGENIPVGTPAFNQWIAGRTAAVQNATKGFDSSIAAIKLLIEVTTGAGSAMGSLANKKQLIDQVMASTGPTGDAADGLTNVENAAKTLTEQLQEAADAFNQLLNDMVQGTQQNYALADAYAALGKSLADNGTDFSMMTEAGRANMQALMQVVSQYGDVLASQVESGAITVTQAANMMQTYMTNLVQELGRIGVPKKQIDFLVKYLQQVTSANWTVGVGADITGVVNAVNTAQAMLDALAADTNVVARSSGASPASLVASGQYNKYRTSNNIYTGATSFAGQGNAPTISLPDFNQILNQSGLDETAKNIAEYNKKAGDAAKKAGKEQKDAADKASEALKQQEQYIKDVADYYRNLGKSMYTLVDAEGSTFQALQKLGLSLDENGKSFNTFTERGRNNLSALEDVFNSFGDVLGTQVENGTLSAADAMTQFKQLAAGVYSELLKLGVPAKDISAFFKGIGIDTTGWKNAGDAVSQYEGFITAAAKAAQEASTSIDTMTGKLLAQKDAMDDYITKLQDGFSAVYDSAFTLPEAVDATTKAIQDLRDRMADAAKSVKDLREQNEQLQQTLQEDSVAANKAYIEYQLSLKYGERDRAADYRSQYEAAKLKMKQDKEQIKTNDQQIKSIEQHGKELQGNSKEALENRDSLRQLQKTMLDQIAAYARAGHSQQEVERYTERLKRQFEQQAKAVGFSSSQLQPYIARFDKYIQVIRDIPPVKTTKVTGTATLDTSPADRALNSLSKKAKTVLNGKGTFTTTAKLTGVTAFKRAIARLPKRGDYNVVSHLQNTDHVKKAAKQLTGGGNYNVNVKPKVLPFTIPKKTINAGLNQQALKDSWNTFVANIRKANPLYGDRFLQGIENKGGLIGAATVAGFASGGLVPGTPPANPQQDNLLARGPDGLYAIRSHEYVMPEPAVRYYGVPYMNAVRDMQIPRAQMYSGGPVGGAGVLGANGGLTGVIVQLSPEDRRILMQSGDRPVVVQITDRQVASASSRGGASNARMGGR